MKKRKRRQISLWTEWEKISNVLETQDMNLCSYEIEMWNDTKVAKNIVLFHLIGLKINWIELKLVEKILKICLGIRHWIFFKKRHKFDKTPFYASLLGNGLNKIEVGIW
jgi:hypothetical protein